MKILLHTAAIIAVLSLDIAGAPSAQAPAADRDLKKRVDTVAKQLDDDSRRELSDEKWAETLASAAKAVRADITRFVETQMRPGAGAPAMEKRLRAALKDQENIDEDSDAPTVREASLRNGRSLVVAYTVARPLHADTAEIYGFHDDGGRYRLVATTGLADFEGFSLFTREVPSPAPGVMFLLAGGQALTANAALIRFRLYMFDGGEFTTLWEPDEMFNAAVTVTPRGFDINRVDRPSGDSVTEHYQVTLNGVVKLQ